MKKIIAAKKGVAKKRKAARHNPDRHTASTKALPQGSGTTSAGHFYRVEIRSKGDFNAFRSQSIGKSGDVERISGKRKGGTWDTVTWLVGKDKAHLSPTGELILDDKKARVMLSQIGGEIVRVDGNVFRAASLTKPTKKKQADRTRTAPKKHLTIGSKKAK